MKKLKFIYLFLITLMIVSCKDTYHFVSARKSKSLNDRKQIEVNAESPNKNNKIENDILESTNNSRKLIETGAKIKSFEVVPSLSTIKLNTKQFSNLQQEAIKKIENDQIREHQNASGINALSQSPCPNNSTKILLWGLILCGLGLLLAAIGGGIGAILGGVSLIVGLLLLLVGLNIPDPYKTSTTPLPIQETKDSIPEPLAVPQFDYQAPTADNSKDISLALLSPLYANEFKYKSSSPFIEFSKAMQKDFEEILTEKHFTFIGPFKAYDEMVFSEKSKTDLMLEIEITVNWSENIQAHSKEIPQYAMANWSCGKTTKERYGSITKYTFDGQAGIGAEISLKYSEIMTKQKVKAQKISIDPEYISVSSDKLYTSNVLPSDVWTKDPGFYNPLVHFLENYYKTILQKAWNYLDPNELKLLKPDIEKIRKESGFSRN